MTEKVTLIFWRSSLLEGLGSVVIDWLSSSSPTLLVLSLNDGRGGKETGPPRSKSCKKQYGDLESSLSLSIDTQQIQHFLLNH